MNSQRIKELAYTVGFDLCGICSPEVIPEARERYYRWLELEYHAEMGYLAKDPIRRSDPSLLLDGARSVIMLGLNYYQPNSAETPMGYGRVARYARGKDYHKVVAKKTKEMIGLISDELGDRQVTPSPDDNDDSAESSGRAESELGDSASAMAGPDGTGTGEENGSRSRKEDVIPQQAAGHRNTRYPLGHREFRWFVDYGPMLERAYAEKAGLGYIGRNGLLISRQFGSWIFLSEIITSLELTADDPRAIKHGTCGTCKKCMEACPTGAIVEDRVVDSSKCISYLTIERPSQVPDDLAAKIGDRIFGCDVCQEVCPHNYQRQKMTKHEQFLSGGVGEFVDTRKVLAMQTREDFLALTAGTPLTRTRLEGMKRNAEIIQRSRRSNSLL
ncbi:MAG: DUF1730 domain-containing protein [candidate division Zixibacteria bacterium]|nr:DUF1730 domain-containing protein [candidate division Zixibacteria bacterium]